MKPSGFTHLIRLTGKALPIQANTSPLHSLVRFRRRLLLLGCLIAATLIGGSIWLLRVERQEALDAARREAIGLSRALEEHVARTFGEIDSTLELLSDSVEARGGLATVSPRILNSMVQSASLRLMQTRTLMISNPRGEALAWSQDPEFIRTHPPVIAPITERPGGDLNIGSPQADPVSDHWQIPISRILRDNQGHIAGAVAALLNQAYFEGFYRDLGLPEGSIVEIIREDHELLIRHPFRQTELSGNLATSPVFLKFARQKDGSFTDAQAADEVVRLTAFQRLLNYPLIVTVGIPETQILSRWQREVWRVLLADTLLIGLLAAVLVLLDRDARTQAQQRAQLEQTNAELEQRVEERTAETRRNARELVELSYAISHDLRASLRAIHGFASIIRDDESAKLSDFGKEALVRIQRASGNMETLIDDLLALLDLSRAPLKASPLDLITLAQDSLRQTNQRGQHESALTLAAPSILPVYADRQHCQLLLDHLFDFAWKMGVGEHNQLTLQTLSARNGFRIVLPRPPVLTTLDKLFEPFQTLKGRHGQFNTGINLALARRITERHHGSIQAHQGQSGEMSIEVWLGDPEPQTSNAHEPT